MTAFPSSSPSAPVLVTGGSGFVGQHLVRALRQRGDLVRILDRDEPEALPQGVEFVRGSILDEAVVMEAMRGVGRIYHLAGIPHLWARDTADFDRANAQGTRVVLRCAQALGIGRLVHCSTESILLPKRKRGTDAAIDGSVAPPHEDMPGPYTRSKLAAEQAALEAARSGFDVVIVNPTVPVGPGDRNRTPPAAMLAMFLQGGSPAYLDCVLNLVDVRDVAEGMILAGDRGRAGERYVLGGDNLRLSEYLRLIEEISGRKMPTWAIPAWVALAAAVVSEWIADHVTGRTPAASLEGVRVALRSHPFDSRKAREELGYAPRPIRFALADAIRWLAAGDERIDGVSVTPEAG